MSSRKARSGSRATRSRRLRDASSRRGRAATSQRCPELTAKTRRAQRIREENFFQAAKDLHLSSTDEHGSAVPFICVHRCSSVVHFALFTARRITPVPG